MMPSTAYLLGAPLVLLLPVYLFRRLRPWGAILSAVVLALETYACLRLPPDVGWVVYGRAVALSEGGRIALAWIAGASALLAVAHAFATSDSSPAVFLLPAVSFAGLALAVGPFPLAFLTLWIAMLLAAFLFRASSVAACRGLSQFLALTAVGIPAFLLAAVLLARSLAVGPDEVPPWNSIAILIVAGSAAWLSFFPFHAWLPGLVGTGQPLAAGWVAGIVQPLVLVTLARVMQVYPELAAQPQAQHIVLIAAAVSAAVGAIGAAFARRPGRMLGYTALTAMAPLFVVTYASAGISTSFWMAALAYSAAVVLASIGLAGVERDGKPVTLSDWSAAARGRGASVALLLSGALSLCGLPLGVGFWAHITLRANLPAVPAAALLILQAAPLVAAIGWWRVLRASAQGQEGKTQPLSRAAQAFFWALALLSAALFVWPVPLARLAEAFARAFGSL